MDRTDEYLRELARGRSMSEAPRSRDPYHLIMMRLLAKYDPPRLLYGERGARAVGARDTGLSPDEEERQIRAMPPGSRILIDPRYPQRGTGSVRAGLSDRDMEYTLFLERLLGPLRSLRSVDLTPPGTVHTLDFSEKSGR